MVSGIRGKPEQGPTIAVVILTFDNPERLRPGLKALSDQAELPDRVFLVNTGKLSLDWVQGEFPNLEIKMLRFGDLGCAGGFREGTKQAFAEGFDYIIQADDDAVPSPGCIAGFRRNAGQGRMVVAGYYSTGAAILHSNHYFMIHRSVYEKTGFYFPQFFFMNEDVEFPYRLAPFAKPHNDPGIVIHHPFYPEIESGRHYYYLRNSLAHSSAIKNLGAFLLLQNFLLSKSLFFLFIFRSADFLRAFFDGYLDFLAGRLGKSDRVRGSLALPKAEPMPCNPETVLIPAATDPEKIVSGCLPENVVKTDIFSGQIRYLPLRQLVPGALRLIWRLRGRNLLVAHPLLAALPPFSLFAKAVYVHDEKEGCFRLLYRNNPLLLLMTAFVIGPAVVLATVPGVLFFFLKAGFYKKMFDSSKAEDLEFCKKHAKYS